MREATAARPHLEARRGIVARTSLLVGIAILLSTVGLVVAAYGPLPFWDQWDNLVSANDITWAWLTGQHNEHRIVLARLIFLADAMLSRETNVLEFVLNVAFQAATSGLMIRLGRGRSRGVPSVWIVGLVLGLMFSAMQDENFTWAFQVQFFAICTLAVATLMILATVPASAASLAIAVGLEAAALYTLSSGAVLLFTTIAVAVWIRRPPAHVAVLTLAAVLLLASYLWGYATPPDHADPLEALSHLHRIALYVVVALGHPVGVLMPAHKTIAAALFGGVGALWFAAWAWRMAGARDRVPPEEVALFAIACFVVGMAVLIGLGRWRFGIEQAMAPRYATPILLFWLALLLREASLGDAVRQLRVMSLGLAVLLALAVNQPRFIVLALRLSAARQSAAVAVLTGVDDDELLRRTYPAPQDVMARRDAMKAARASVFAPDWASWLDQPYDIPAGWPVPACAGSFERVTQVGAADHPGWRANGRLDLHAVPKATTRLILVDAAGTVRGYGQSGLSDRMALSGTSQSGSEAWIGEVELVDPATIRAYGLRPDGLPTCSFGPPRQVVR